MNNILYGLTSFIPFHSYYYGKKTRRVSSFSARSSELVCSNSAVRYDVVVVGAGVAGSALAYALGKSGRRVHLIERNLKAPDTIAGEVLQPAGYLKLLELGLGDCVRDIDAQKMVGYAIIKDGKSLALPYPLESHGGDVTARAFHHGRFVHKLRQKAASLSNVNLEQGNVTSLIEEDKVIKGVRYKKRNGEESSTHASLTIVCDGGFSNLRKFLSNPKIDKTSHFAGMILENCQIPHPNSIHFVFGDPVHGLFYPISSTQVRFIADLRGIKVPSISNGKMAHYLKTVMASTVPPQMYNAFMTSVEKGDVRVMPVRSMASAPILKPGAILVGDALNMRHAITGAGMTVALHDVSLLCSLLKHIDLHDSGAATKCTQEFYKKRKPMSFTMNVMSNSFHELLSSSDETKKKIQQACFDYLSLGRGFSKGPLELISGLNQDPGNIMLNLSGLALYTVGSMLFPVPTPTRLYTAAQLALDAASTVVPIILKEV